MNKASALNSAWAIKPPRNAIAEVLAQFPSLPTVVRYYDDFDDKVRSIPEFSSSDTMEVTYAGRATTIEFVAYGREYGALLKYLFVYLIAEDYRASTVTHLLSWFSKVPEETIANLVDLSPNEMNQWWAKERTHGHHTKVFDSLKALVRMLCANFIGRWSPAYYDFIGGLPLPAQDKYRAVRTGDVFLSVEEEARIAHYLDDLATRAAKSATSRQELVEGGALLCSYLFGMRPYQIAVLAMRDVRAWNEDSTGALYVHLTFRMIKQRSKSKTYPLTRRVKHEWTPIIAELYRREKEAGRGGADRLFGVDSAQGMSHLIVKVASQITGADVSATDLRHTAAQRLVDAGASQEEVAEFMGHSDISTCLVYYTSSPNQAERVNKALGISPIYQHVAKIAHAKFISPEELAQLKGDQQIAGVPHGIQIAGIGGCTTGQPSCQYNPITSCYGCQKFMPVIDIELHKQVLKDMRSVVKFFAESSRGDGDSPAFMQLKRTIASIQSVINELEAPDA
ncbi:MAG: tyrosine-type recombinase/integrase [Nitrosomonadales bacterium]|nr:tyrosine-type recombinase/integrase [Nitrosomonadales bacterium]